MKSVFLYLGLVAQLGLAVVISIMAGLFVGIFIDRLIQTKMIFTIIFVIFGVIGGFIGAYKLIIASPHYPSEKEENRKEEGWKS
jgi:F0F1-type ATP synthase assembly protein I